MLMFCFVHIEKAAGTTLHTIFLNNYWSYVQITPRVYWTNEEHNAFLKEEAFRLSKILKISKGFGGHTVRSYLDYESALERDVKYITFLRNPITRYISHYNYQRNIMGIDRSLDEFLAEEKFSNFMTKRLAGSYDLKKAKERLSNSFSFVGITELFDESLLIMKYRLFDEKFNLNYKKRNVAKPCQSDKLSKEYIERIQQNNLLDLELYEHAKEIFENRYKKEYPRDLSIDLEEFKKNKRKSISKNRITHRILSRGYDLIFNTIESKIHYKYHY